MNKEHRLHMESIVEAFSELARAKYRAGQKEHGGQLWNKHGLLDMAIDEAIDQVVYLVTLKQQLEGTFEDLLEQERGEEIT